MQNLAQLTTRLLWRMFKEKIVRLLLSLAWLGAATGTSAAGNAFIIEKDPSEFTSSFALQYWYGFGNTSKDLYGFTRDELVSRLSYTGMSHANVILFTYMSSVRRIWSARAGSVLP